MIFVYGRWWRAGTSLLVRMVDTGGAAALRDPGCSVWQHTEALAEPAAVLGPMIETPRVVKVFPRQVAMLQMVGLHPTAVLAPTRPWQQSCDSWVALGHQPLPPEEEMLAADRCLRDNWARAGVPVLNVPFHDLIDESRRTTEAIEAFLAPHVALDVAAMAALPDPALRHYHSA